MFTYLYLAFYLYIHIVICSNSISHSFPSHLNLISHFPVRVHQVLFFRRWIVNSLAVAMLEATARVMMRPWVALLDRTFSGWRRWAAPPRGGRWIGMMIDPWVGCFDVWCHPRLVAKRVFLALCHGLEKELWASTTTDVAINNYLISAYIRLILENMFHHLSFATVTVRSSNKPSLEWPIHGFWRQFAVFHPTVLASSFFDMFQSKVTATIK